MDSPNPCLAHRGSGETRRNGKGPCGRLTDPKIIGFQGMVPCHERTSFSRGLERELTKPGFELGGGRGGDHRGSFKRGHPGAGARMHRYMGHLCKKWKVWYPDEKES